MTASHFYPSALRAQRDIVVPFVRTHSFGYYTNMVQHFNFEFIKFIIHTNIQPLPALFLRKVKGQGQRFKKILVNAITGKIIIGSLNFLREVTHEYGDDLIRFSAFHQ